MSPATGYNPIFSTVEVNVLSSVLGFFTTACTIMFIPVTGSPDKEIS